jgi:hypothetical protein
VTIYLRAQIIRWASDDFPGFVECTFADNSGREWSIIEKAPVVSEANIFPDSQFPQPAFIGCAVLAWGRDYAGREIAEITTEKPWHIESVDGTSTFQVYAEQLVGLPAAN